MEFRKTDEKSMLLISEDVLAKFKRADLSKLSVQAKTEMSKLLGGWFESNIGSDSPSVRDVREVSDRLLEVIIEEDVIGEFVIFVNNYAAFLVLECEHAFAKHILEQWVKKVKVVGNLEWTVILLGSYVELIFRSCLPQVAAPKVAKIATYL